MGWNRSMKEIMDKIQLTEVIQSFRSFHREGGYWDFKKEWHDNKAELLLDIICMANNIEYKDGYIIIGIHDYTMDAVGVENDKNRKNLNQLSQFVAGKHFAVYIPEVDLQTIELEGHEIDVIIVNNTNHTPYYLEKSFCDGDKTVHHGNVYVRLNDRKAGVDATAPYSCIEHLWKKRFGINFSVMERLSVLLDDREKWKYDWGNKSYAFHEDYPEFRLQLSGEMQEGWWPAAAFYANPGMHFSKLDIMYHNTVIYETEMWVFDEYRKYVPKAANSTVKGKSEFWYQYYNLSTIEGKLLTIFTDGTNCIASRYPNYNQILVFNDDLEKDEFDDYLSQHFDDFSDDVIKEEYKNQIREDNADNGGGLIFSAFQVAKVAKFFSVWRKQKDKSGYD